MRHCLSLALFAGLTAPVFAADPEPKKPGGPLELKLVANKDTYTWDGAGKSPKAFKKMLEDLAAEIKKNPFAGPPIPVPPAVDLSLRIVNTSKKDVDVWVGGDPNEVTLELKGPGVVAFNPGGAFTGELRLARKVTLAPGKHFEIAVARLSDGFRSAGRSIFWTVPGEYTLTAKYQLAKGEEDIGEVLTSNQVKLKVKARKADK